MRREWSSEMEVVVTAHNNDKQYIESKREISRERDTDLTWFDNLSTSIERRAIILIMIKVYINKIYL
jgi:hypothetical protein